jgi:type VI secretion system protein ImpK
VDEGRPDAGTQAVRREKGEGAPRDSLALLYQGFLTGIVRLQAKRQELGQPDSFRRRMQIALKDVQRDAVAAGYALEDVRDAEFAIVAFLDEVVLSSDDPGSREWAKQTLSVELFREARAGEVFFDRLDSYRSRRGATQLADLLEVYLLCLLLGFQGRYVNMPGELHAIADRTYRRIQGVRPLTPNLFPEAQATGTPARGGAPAPRQDNWRMKLVWVLAGCLLCFVLFWLHLQYLLNNLGGQMVGAG